MCGIVGLFTKSDDVAARLGEHVAAMLVQLSDRGPDSAGVAFYREPAPAGSSKVSLHSGQPGYDWAALGAEAALTGPIARGDEATVAAQREALAEAAPELLDLFDLLVHHTRGLAAAKAPA